jgi:two-component system KDP operon response regulator KdpE
MKRRLVLVVDDDRDTQNMLREVLESEGFSVMAAATACDAIAMLNAHRPDLILLDLGLPDVDGHFVASRVSSHWDWFEIPIVVMTGRTDLENQALARVFGAREYLIKPFSMDELRDAVQGALGTTVEG